VRNGSLTFAAAWIPNKGANQIASSWTANSDMPSLANKIDQAKARPIVLRSFVLNGQRRHAAVWVDNTGSHQIGWWWNPDVDAATLGRMLADNKGRLTCLDPYIENGVLKFGGVWVQNSGSHGKAWWWYHGLGAEALGHKLDLFCSYLAELQAYPAGNEMHLACAMYAYPQPNAEGTALLDVSGTASLVSQSDSMAPLDQSQSLSLTLKNKTSSPVTVTGGSVAISESGGFADWRGALVGGGSLLGPGPAVLGPGEVKIYSRNYGWGMGPCHFVVDVQAESGASKQRHHAVIPIIKPGSPAPASIEAPTPVYIGLWRKPAEVFTVWLGNDETVWISVAGQIVNTSQSTVRLAAFHMMLSFDGKVALDQDLALNFWSIGATTNPDPIGADGAAYLPDAVTFFAQGFALKGVKKNFAAGQLTLTANYKNNQRCGACSFESPVRLVPAVPIAPPFKELDAKHFWNLGNGPNHNGIDSHEWPAERYAYDITAVDQNGSTHAKNDDASKKNNTNFYAYGKPVVAVKAGHVVGADDANPENHGFTANPDVGSTQNYVLVKHADGSYAGYYHLRQGKNKVPATPAGTIGPAVVAGQQLGEIGNAGGSSEPHLHFAYTALDATGRGTVMPIVIKGLKTKDGTSVTAVPGNGQYRLGGQPEE
jgi:murein DD-endopeptidase MepM/ murein hydrolase activator NlpD